MKKILLLAALVVASLQLTAANVDLATAKQSATRFLMSQTANGRFMASAPTVKWTHEVKNSSNAAQVAYYIVNTDKGYVIVAGDDRAREVLAWGDGTIENMNDLPDAMQLFLRKYQKQLEYLQAHPGLKVQARSASRGVSVEHLMEPRQTLQYEDSKGGLWLGSLLQGGLLGCSAGPGDEILGISRGFSSPSWLHDKDQPLRHGPSARIHL